MIWIRQKVRVVDGYQRRQSVKGGGKGKKKKKGKERERKIFHIQKGKGACLASSFSISLRYYDAMVGNN